MNRLMKNRREFLTTVGAAGDSSIVAGSTGAVASFAAGGKEKQELLEVLASKQPFPSFPGGPLLRQLSE